MFYEDVYNAHLERSSKPKRGRWKEMILGFGRSVRKAGCVSLGYFICVSYGPPSWRGF